MNKSNLFFFLLVLMSSMALGQTSIGFNDSFQDGDFTNNPTWSGESSKFIVNGSQQLQLNDLVPSSPAYLSTASEVLYKGTWEFYIRLDFAPSTSNNARVYLIADQSDLTVSLNGYYLQIGGISGANDDISLYRQDGNSRVEIIDGIDGNAGADPVEMKIRVTRDSIGNWELYTDLTATGANYISEGTVFDDTHASSRYFGVYCAYTSTRSDKFIFDDFVLSGERIQDTLRPSLLGLQVLSDTSLNMRFSENITAATQSNLLNYSVNKGIGNPSSANYVASDSSQILLVFSSAFSNGESYEISLQGLSDAAGNILVPLQENFLYFVPETPSFRDVVINEVYSDFSPSLGLPEGEFVELYNASNKTFDLSNWSLSDASSTVQLPSYVFGPGEYVILCSNAMLPEFTSYGNAIGLSGFPGLNNDGDRVRISDDGGNVIDEINYNTTWYQDDNKDDGAYTLEQINPLTPCTGKNNFRASSAFIGGTPGSQNSIWDTIPDRTAPILLSATAVSADSIHLLFNEAIDNSSLAQLNVQFSDGNLLITQVLIEPDRNQLALGLMNALDSGIQIQISVQGLRDCIGNLMEETRLTIVLPERLKMGDIIINEVLFNPETGGSDFVEIYNRSTKILDLKELRIANFAGDSLSNIETISEETALFYPGDYRVLTEDPSDIASKYPRARVDKLFEIKDLPSYNDDEGRVILLTEDKGLIDLFDYSEDMHFALLDDLNGVSLERLDPKRPSQDKGNWHSAAATEGYATPGYLNSQDFSNSRFSGTLEVDPELFSPDNDGFQDKVNFNYSFKSPGYVVNLSIYDDQGRLIRRLVRSQLVGRQGSFTWDGIQDDGSKARIGIYLIYLEAFQPDGDKEVIKKPCVLAGQL